MISRRGFLAGAAAVPFLSYASILPAIGAGRQDILVVAQQLDNMTSLDPHESFEAVGSEVCNNMYQRLVHPSLSNPDQVEGGVAVSWEADADGKVFIFKIDPNAKFASGAQITAEDAAFSLQRAIKMNKGPAFIIGQFGFTPENAEKNIVATDPSTLSLTVEQSTSLPFLLYCLSASVASIVEKKTVLENASGDDLGNGWLQKNSAGSGEWVLVSWKPSESIILNVNPHGAYKGNVKRILLRHVADPSSQLLMLQKGDVDIARNLTSEQLRVLQGNGDFELVTKAIAGIGLMSLNQKIEKLTNPKLWQAIKWAVDYQGIQKNIVPLTHKVHQTIIPEGFPGAVNETPFQKDLEKAKGLMQEAGLADGFTIKMDHYSAQPWPDIAQAIQANLAEIGIKVELLAAENRQVLTKMRAREHEIALTAWGSDYFDPNTNADVFCNNPDNSDNAATKPFAWRSSYQNEEFAKKSIAARDERDSAKRIELYENLQREFMNDSPFIVMLQTVTTAACRKDVTGMRLGVLSDSHSYAGIAKA
ncbi:ABC transporter substrate-binding protein [Brucella anthropi]|jgi:peptide/nickel transport system substrate-binding protein|uniref:ABC transporter substrate-binding protein n=1 Tax=Brucella anthropi TaxID=529 RepID=A0A6I0DSY5_BRUAN|nr:MULTISPECIES: ABC transporter substrate-binding protein [Brucella/Ochrobactrum group]QTN04851.1 ABC transporter substrate-binding protein [Ochrobactrum sp. EEELCW01]KAB2740447.1 ABC transporter substrate-binding protein [Brucella anthropi]KAB2757783.1 ABC transporter substrate-binding protein [Brucella anthropi]KAB2769299.1 ABC transporter substrate-binding protein [Brucella anthropi]KAB2799178.1 ABC transporter substrate-binding protein [Brucella anthropi]